MERVSVVIIHNLEARIVVTLLCGNPFGISLQNPFVFSLSLLRSSELLLFYVLPVSSSFDETLH